MRLVEKVRKITRPEVSDDEFAELERKSQIIATFKSDEFSFIYNFFIENREYIKSVILENRLRDTTDQFQVGQSLVRTLMKPKEDELKELSGKYILIKDFFNMLEQVEQDYQKALKSRSDRTKVR